MIWQAVIWLITLQELLTTWMYYFTWTVDCLNVLLYTNCWLPECITLHELSTVWIYNFAGMYCSNFTTKCVNDGYVTQIDGVCSCMCVDGLDRNTGCSTVVKSGMYDW